VISRRTILLIALWALAVAIPTSYSKGRVFEGRRIEPDNYIQEHSVLNAIPIVFIRTLVGGEPEILRVFAGVGLLLTGACAISFGFDYAPKRQPAKLAMMDGAKQERDQIVSEVSQEIPGITIQDASD
jgi:hypothetical protein